ncbi:MAG: hypothetical protein KDC92_00405 [Bacteroidetes bacterium]|nr:hypothetical protein [Bacteroidota bacterium]
MKHSVLLDTSFFVHLLNDEDALHRNALGYFNYFLDHEITLKISTISIAEYCVRGKIDELPLRNLQIIPFNLNHGKRTGEFARILFDANHQNQLNLTPRAIIPNDSKLFAQADLDQTVTHFVTSDVRSNKTFNTLKSNEHLKFEIIDISTPYNERFGVLNF